MLPDIHRDLSRPFVVSLSFAIRHPGNVRDHVQIDMKLAWREILRGEMRQGVAGMWALRACGRFGHVGVSGIWALRLRGRCGCVKDTEDMKVALGGVLVVAGLLAGCAGPHLPAPNTTEARYDARDLAVQVLASGLQPVSGAALVSESGTRYPASGVSILSSPHVLYNPPPSVGLSIGGFGFTGCCSGIGSGVGVGLPVGRPTLSEVSDQYVASALIPIPPDYPAHWSSYRLEVLTGSRSITLAAPTPAG